MTSPSVLSELRLARFTPRPGVNWRQMGWRQMGKKAESAVSAVMGIRMCGEMDLVECVLLAGFVAIVAHPLVYGTLGSSIVALMTPVR